MKEGEQVDAELDVVTWSPEPGLSLQLDVSVRHPAADRYIKQSRRTDGAAARKAEQEKQARYPSRNGIRVATFAIETFGRLGNEASETMQKLATAAAERDELRGMQVRNRVRRWQVQMSRTLFRATARTLLESTGAYVKGATRGARLKAGLTQTEGKPESGLPRAELVS